MSDAAAAAKPMAVHGPIASTWFFACFVAAALLHGAIKKYRLLPTVLMLSVGLQIGAVVFVPLGVLAVRRWGAKSEDTKDTSFQREAISFAWLPRPLTCVGYCLLGACVWFATGFPELDLLRAGSALQVAAFAGLLGRAAFSRSAFSLSLRKLLLDALCLGCRLAATAMLGRRLPRKSADPFVMAADGCSLLVALILLLLVKFSRSPSNRAEADTFPLTGLLLGAFALAVTLRAPFGGTFIADALWSFALYLDVVAMLPQLFMIAQMGGVADVAMSHHVAGIFGSRLLGLMFWWLIKGTWLGGQVFTGWCILIALTWHLVLLSRFMGYYFQAYLPSPFSSVPVVCAEG